MTNFEEYKLFSKICHQVSEMMPDNMTDAEYFAMYSRLAADFANRVTKYLYAIVDEEKHDPEEDDSEEDDSEEDDPPH